MNKPGKRGGIQHVTGETEAFFLYRPGLLGNLRERGKRENNAQEESSYLRPGLVTVSDAMVLGVLTLDLHITVISKKTKGSKSEKIGRTIEVSDAPLTRKREVGKTQNSKYTQAVRGIVLQSRKRKRVHACVWYVGGQNTRRRTGNWVPW